MISKWLGKRTSTKVDQQRCVWTCRALTGQRSAAAAEIKLSFSDSHTPEARCGEPGVCEVCVDEWSSVLAVVDVDDCVQEGDKLLRYRIRHGVCGCADVRSSFWAAVEFDVGVQERVRLPGYREYNATMCGISYAT